MGYTYDDIDYHLLYTKLTNIYIGMYVRVHNIIEFPNVQSGFYPVNDDCAYIFKNNYEDYYEDKIVWLGYEKYPNQPGTDNTYQAHLHFKSTHKVFKRINMLPPVFRKIELII
jgi:hypothetical protein